MNGDVGVVLAVNKQSGINTVQVAQRVLRQMDRLTEENAALEWGILMDQSDYINLSVDQALSNIVFGVILALLMNMRFRGRNSGGYRAAGIPAQLRLDGGHFNRHADVHYFGFPDYEGRWADPQHDEPWRYHDGRGHDRR